ncbi:MAG: glycosyl hydrolase [Candidatus Omnitrophota bacterium]|nr:glycosyl hydrolase [Candidatus Omnitrophota bacterium]
MKKITIAIILGISIVLIASALIFTFSRIKGADKVYIKTLEGKRFQLAVNNKPYIIKGMVYNPVPIGQNHEYDLWSDSLKPHMVDGELMKQAGVNTIRVYQPGRHVKNTKETIRDLYNIFGIRVVIGHWLGFWEDPNYVDPLFRERVKKDVLDMVRTYKDEKGILLWILGNENNVSFSFGPQSTNLWTTDEIEKLDDPYLKRQARARFYYSFVNEIAKEIHEIDPNHPVALANAELTDIEVAKEVTPDIDIVACSIYRGKSFGSFFREAQKKFDKPILITELGCDRYDALLEKENQAVQAEFIEAELKEVEKNTFIGNGIGNSIGCFVFEWTDEWWKLEENDAYAWGVHDTGASWSNGAYYFDIKAPQNMNINEEWWGVCELKKNKLGGLDERIPTKAYFKVKELWK